MRVLALNGSARGAKGVTQRLLEALLKGMTTGGATCELLQVASLEVAPCLACLTCMHKTPGRCAQRDDMDQIYPKLQAADMLVLATPVYTDSMSAQLKVVMDRCICFMQPFLRMDQAGRVRHPLTCSVPQRWALVSTCGFPEPETFGSLISTVRAQAANFGCQVMAELCVPGSMALQMAPEHLEGHLAMIEQAGDELVRHGRINPALRARLERPPLGVDHYLKLAKRYEDWVRKKLGQG